MIAAALLLLQAGPAGPTQAQLEWARRTWEVAGRAQVADRLGLRRDPGSGRWSAITNWPGVRTVSARAYDTEPVLTPALDLAEATHDTALLGEIADLFLATLARFESLDTLRAHAHGRVTAGELDRTSDGALRVLPWWNGSDSDGGAVECQLCQQQFLYPAARAVRLARTWWAAGAEPAVVHGFTHVYLPLLVQDHLLRFGYEAPAGITAGGDASRPLVEVWEAAGDQGNATLRPWTSSFRDRDMWLIATAAELLATPGPSGGHDPLQGHRDEIRRMLLAGERRMRAQLTPHPDRRDRRGRVVGSVAYGEGMWDGHPDFRFAGDTGSLFPTTPAPPRRTAWDLSHLTRLPVTLRALWETREAAGSSFPDSALLAGIARQYALVAFGGDLAAPRFANFFDGTDGWYRVGYSGRGNWGYPPSRDCDARDPERPCVGTWAARGWGLLAFAQPSVDTIQQSLLRLAASRDPADIALRDRWYSWSGAAFSFDAPPAGKTPSLVLMAIVAELALGQRP